VSQPPPSGPPPGPSQGPPRATQPPPSGGGTAKTKQRTAIGIGALIIVVVVVAVFALSGGSSDKASAAEVKVEPVNTAGNNPFMPSVGTDQSNVTPPAGATSSNQNVASYSGDTPGLYGGTRNIASCDPAKMVAFLEANPDKGSAWADVVGIAQSDIRSYVSTLTPVILRTDTYVMNHGFENGRATDIPAVLQAGTAVLVDKYGEPVAKCYCGNPLTAAHVYTSPRYYGPRWPTFTPTSVTVIVKTTVVINTFTLVDPATGNSFSRPAGTTGNRDGDAPGKTPPPPTTTVPPTTTAPPTTTTPTTSPPPSGPTLAEQEQAASDRIAQASQQCYPFPPPIQDSTGASTSFSEETSTSFVITVVTNLVGGGNQTFIWRVDRGTGAFTPLNDLATTASNHCSLLN
jgi:hypothetical protein